MATGRSFAEFVKDRCYNVLSEAGGEYPRNNQDDLNLYSQKLRRVGDVDFIESLCSRPAGLQVAFEAGLEMELELNEADCHYDETAECSRWIYICCEGTLFYDLDDWEIKRITLRCTS